LRIYQYQHTEEVIEVYTIIYSWIFPSITKVVEIEAEAVLLRSLAGAENTVMLTSMRFFFHIT